MVCQLYHTTYLLFLIIFPPVKYWPQFDWLPLSDVYSPIIISPPCSAGSQQQQLIGNIAPPHSTVSSPVWCSEVGRDDKNTILTYYVLMRHATCHVNKGTNLTMIFIQ